MKLEVTKERVLRAAEKCSNAKEVLEELFPGAFEDEEGGGDITPELIFKPNPYSSGDYYIDFYYTGIIVGYIGHDKICVTNSDYQLMKQNSGTFKIIKK